MEAAQQMLAVVAVLGLLGGALWWLRRKGLASFAVRNTARGTRRMQAIERLALTPQHSLHLVRVGERVLLVAVSPGGCAVLPTAGDADGASQGAPR